MTLSSPTPFREAIAQLAQREIMPTSLDTAGLRLLDRNVRERSFFSARNLLTDLLDAEKKKIELILNPAQIQRPDRITPTNPEGWVSQGIDYATARSEIKQLAAQLGYQPDPDLRGGLQDLSSDARINLVLKTNVQLAQGYGYKMRGQAPGVLDEYPAWELIRAEDREVPRGYRRKGTMIVPVPEESWPARWRRAAESTGKTEGDGWVITSGRMVAMKNHPIWMALGNSALFDDALDTDYPPFAFNSGMWVEDVAWDELAEVGLGAGQTPPQPMDDFFKLLIE